MKKILGIGNALVDALIQIDNDNILKELSLHKGGMTLIEEDTHKKIANRLKSLSFKRSTGGSAGNALACVAAAVSVVLYLVTGFTFLFAIPALALILAVADITNTLVNNKLYILFLFIFTPYFVYPFSFS